MDGKGLPVCIYGCDGVRDDEIQTDGQSLVFTGGMEEADGFIARRMSLDGKMARLPSGETRTDLGAEAEKAARKLVGIFASMTVRQVLTIHAMLNGAATLAAAARVQGVTKQAVHKAIKSLLEAEPGIKRFFKTGRNC